MGKTLTPTVHFVCVRPSHHRHRTSADCLCEHMGGMAYCPAGDVGDHDWLPVSTDTVCLGDIGWAGEVPTSRQDRVEDHDLILIR